MPETSPRFLRRAWARRALPAGVVAVILIAATVVTHANATASPVDTYRTSAVTTGSVQQRLELTGSARRVNQVSERFAVAGTVSSLSVTVGDTVRAGQTLATLDPTPLLSAVTAAKASLAKAQATLETDQSATATATSTATTSTRTTSTATTSPRVASTAGRSGGGTQPSLATAQKRVTTSQRAIAADLQKASAALTQCAQLSPTGTPPPTASTTSSRTSSRTSSPTPTRSSPTTTTTNSPAGLTAACLRALKSAPTQRTIQRDQQSLTQSQTELTQAFTLAITTAGNTSAATATATPSGSAGQSSSAQSSAGQSSAGQSGASGAARVVSDEAAVTDAEAALKSAQADRASARLTSSIAGTVGSVSIVKGTSSNGKTIVIVGAGAVEVTVNVPLASMAGVHLDQKANVTPQGAPLSVKGSVTSISLLPTATATGSGTGSTTSGTGSGSTTTSASSPTYPVVVLVPDALPALATGSRANVSLLIGTVSHALTVPNSALTPLANGQALAVTVKNGVATRALVKTGYVGTLTTQVTSGLTAGQQVVLADLSTALPTNTTSSRRFGVGAGGAGGFGGAGLGAGAVTGGAGFAPRG